MIGNSFSNLFIYVFVFCQITEFSYGLGLMGHSVYAKNRHTSLLILHNVWTTLDTGYYFYEYKHLDSRIQVSCGTLCMLE